MTAAIFFIFLNLLFLIIPPFYSMSGLSDAVFENSFPLSARIALYHTLSSYVRSGPVPYSSVKILNDIQFIRFSVKEKKEYIAPVSLSQPLRNSRLIKGYHNAADFQLMLP